MMFRSWNGNTDLHGQCFCSSRYIIRVTLKISHFHYLMKLYFTHHHVSERVWLSSVLETNQKAWACYIASQRDVTNTFFVGVCGYLGGFRDGMAEDSCGVVGISSDTHPQLVVCVQSSQTSIMESFLLTNLIWYIIFIWWCWSAIRFDAHLCTGGSSSSSGDDSNAESLNDLETTSNFRGD